MAADAMGNVADANNPLVSYLQAISSPRHLLSDVFTLIRLSAGDDVIFLRIRPPARLRHLLPLTKTNDWLVFYNYTIILPESQQAVHQALQSCQLELPGLG
jgi:hypothetical protein